jgi:hypothetical protein
MKSSSKPAWQTEEKVEHAHVRSAQQACDKSVAAHHPLAGRANVVSPRLTILTNARALRQNLLTTMMMTFY